ncbi:site-specific integrase [Pontitalea aquivivens]|uniref:hypothetical protein n=1 Tax=Pontitalea aquivivens TaxID=3388663 RepID=UPI003970B00E
MLDRPQYTAQDALDLVLEGSPQILEGKTSSIPGYSAALTRLTKRTVKGLITTDLSTIPMTMEFIDHFFEQLNKDSPPQSKKEIDTRRDWQSRLRTICRRLEGIPVVQKTPAWDSFLDHIRDVGEKRGYSEEALIPVTSTFRAVAVEAGIEPHEVTRDWLMGAMKGATKKRRDSLKRGIKVLDDLWTDLPEQQRPPEPFGPIKIISEKRRSLPLPPRVKTELETYLADRIAGNTAPGFTRAVSVKKGIDPRQSTNIYRQAVGWLYDSLCVVGELDPDADIGLNDLANLEWLSKVAFEALSEIEADAGTTRTFPWKPIEPETIYNRTGSLITIFESTVPDFHLSHIEIFDANKRRTVKKNPEGLRKILCGHCSDEMTDEHRAFCRALVTNEEKQHLFLNMHMICWEQAQSSWKTYAQQTQHEKNQTINLCVLAAMLALVVNIPFRARTVCEMVLEGSQSDLSLPKDAKKIAFHVAPARMKTRERFDADVNDDKLSKPRKILDWFIAGPRKELLRNPKLLPEANRRPERLFCGIGEARYNRILGAWTEEVGMLMTTHMFRHALASFLINCCGVPVADAARMLGNSIAVAERRYVFLDVIKRRSNTLKMVADHRQHLADLHHPGRRRKK